MFTIPRVLYLVVFLVKMSGMKKIKVNLWTLDILKQKVYLEKIFGLKKEYLEWNKNKGSQRYL